MTLVCLLLLLCAATAKEPEIRLEPIPKKAPVIEWKVGGSMPASRPFVVGARSPGMEESPAGPSQWIVAVKLGTALEPAHAAAWHARVAGEFAHRFSASNGLLGLGAELSLGALFTTVEQPVSASATAFALGIAPLASLNVTAGPGLFRLSAVPRFGFVALSFSDNGRWQSGNLGAQASVAYAFAVGRGYLGLDASYLLIRIEPATTIDSGTLWRCRCIIFARCEAA